MNTTHFTPRHCKVARALASWDQQALAARAGVGLSTVADFERGARNPQGRSLIAMMQAFDREADIVFGNEGPTVRQRPAKVAELPLNEPEPEPERVSIASTVDLRTYRIRLRDLTHERNRLFREPVRLGDYIYVIQGPSAFRMPVYPEPAILDDKAIALAGEEHMKALASVSAMIKDAASQPVSLIVGTYPKPLPGIECQDCGGSGHEHECQFCECECRKCAGNGSFEQVRQVVFEHSAFNEGVLRRLLGQLPNLSIAVGDHGTGPRRFTFSGPSGLNGEGIIACEVRKESPKHPPIDGSAILPKVRAKESAL